jgi:hypothetical protein
MRDIPTVDYCEEQLATWGQVIYLRDRNMTMLKKDLILRNPLRLIDQEGDQALGAGEFGAVLARAGVGKTAFLVQLALNSLLRENNVLHVSLNDPVNKVVLWYREVLADIARQYNVAQIEALWEAILPHRFVMTFQVEGFTVPKLEERLSDLTQQGIFVPKMILLDGFPFNESARESLLHLKALAKTNHMHAWFAIQTHREDPGFQGATPPPLDQVADLFELAVQLQPEADKIHVRTVKEKQPGISRPGLVLDPSTMLITDKS